MSLIHWERFRGKNKAAASSSGKWPQMPWQIRKENRTPASALTETDTEFVLTARIRGSHAGDVVVILEDSTLVIQADIEQDNGNVVFKGTSSFWFNLPGEVDAKSLRMIRDDDVITVYVGKLAVHTEGTTKAALA